MGVRKSRHEGCENKSSSANKQGAPHSPSTAPHKAIPQVVWRHPVCVMRERTALIHSHFCIQEEATAAELADTIAVHNEIDKTENQKPNGPLASYNSATATLCRSTLMYSSYIHLAHAHIQRSVRVERGRGRVVDGGGGGRKENPKKGQAKCISPWQWRKSCGTIPTRRRP